MAGTLSKGVATTTTITFDGTTYKVANAGIQKPVTREAANVTSLDETVAHYVAGALENWDEFTITVYDTGTAPSTSTASAVYSITSTITDGTNTSSVSVSFKALLTKIAPGEIAFDGDRKATLQLTFQPSGETVTAQGS